MYLDLSNSEEKKRGKNTWKEHHRRILRISNAKSLRKRSPSFYYLFIKPAEILQYTYLQFLLSRLCFSCFRLLFCRLIANVLHFLLHEKFSSHFWFMKIASVQTLKWYFVRWVLFLLVCIISCLKFIIMNIFILMCEVMMKKFFFQLLPKLYACE